VLADESVDAVIVICTPTFAAPPLAVAAAVREVAAGAGKPVVACFLAWPDMPSMLRSESGDGIAVPAFSSPEPGARALARAAAYAEWRRRPPGALLPLAGFDAEAARRTITEFLSTSGPGWLPPDAVGEVLRAIGVPWLDTTTVTSAGDAAAVAGDLAVPVVLTSDVGGVRLDLDGPSEVAMAYEEMAARMGDRMDGAIVQPMAAPGVETIVGLVLDPLFGPLVMFGLGGVATELLGDRSFRILPLTDTDAAELVRSLRSSPLLFGYRGSVPVAVDALEDLLQRVGRLAGLVPELAELDLNPVIASTRGVEVADARIRVAPAVTRPGDDVRRMS
jgi:acyl-CoA synthetase (NDP forming)